MPKLMNEELKYYKEFIEKSKSEHTKSFKSKNNIEELVQSYEGVSKRMQSISNSPVNENHVFVATNTLVPTLYYQNPIPLIRSNKTEFDYSAAILTEVAKHYMDQDFKFDNQMCVLDAWYGYGCMKCGYQVNKGQVPASKVRAFLTKMLQLPNSGATQEQPDSQMEEEMMEYIDSEYVINERQSPNTTFLDHTKKWGKGEAVTFEYKRKLSDVVRKYNPSTNFINYFSRGGDIRKVDVVLWEHYCIVQDKVYKLIMIEGWDEPLYWETRYIPSCRYRCSGLITLLTRYIRYRICQWEASYRTNLTT